MPIEVIGAGFGRTGTNSLRRALEELGFGPCYHMYECTANGDAPAWILAKQTVRQDCGVALAGLFDRIHDQGEKKYRSTVDFPGCIYYKQLMEAYPDAKVVLSVRDSFEAWYQSARSTIGSAAHWREVHVQSWVLPTFRRIPQLLWMNAWGNPVSVPGVPFPRSNDTDEFNRRVAAWNMGLYAAAAAAFALAAVGIAVALRARNAQ
jgi:Sulfotransferase domain